MPSTKKEAPSQEDNKKLLKPVDKVSSGIVHLTGNRSAFVMAFIVIIAWAITGVFFNYRQRWQLIINTGTCIVTFLMVFVIRQSQNKDTTAKD